MKIFKGSWKRTKSTFQEKKIDETGVTIVLDQAKIIATLGQKQVGQAMSTERG